MVVFDHDFLGYPDEGDSLYYKWTFGEIYVTEGLEDAMNIDRASFKTQHNPEYVALIISVHDKLRSEVFNSVQKRWRKRTAEKRQVLEDVKTKWRKNSAKKVFGKEFEVVVKRSFTAKPVSVVNLSRRLIEINPINDILAKFPSKERQFLQDILTAVAMARTRYPTNPNKQDVLLLELLARKYSGKRYPKPTLKYDKSQI